MRLVVLLLVLLLAACATTRQSSQSACETFPLTDQTARVICQSSDETPTEITAFQIRLAAARFTTDRGYQWFTLMPGSLSFSAAGEDQTSGVTFEMSDSPLTNASMSAAETERNLGERIQ